MNISFQAFAYVFLIIIGAWLLGFTADGHIIKICIACNSVAANLFAIVSIATGIIGIAGTVASKKALSNAG